MASAGPRRNGVFWYQQLGPNSIVIQGLLAFWIAHTNDAIGRLRQISSEHGHPLAALAAQHVAFVNNGCNQQGSAVPPDCILVLGHDLSANGTPSDELLSRLGASLEYSNRHPDARLVVSGGLPKGGVSQAQVMAGWLVAKGVPQSSITLEDASTDTVDNIVMSAMLLKKTQRAFSQAHYRQCPHASGAGLVVDPPCHA